jgi:hypothetical protein
MTRLIKSIFIIFLIISCSDNDKKTASADLAKQLTGEWNNIYLKVETVTKQDTGTNETLEVSQDDWEQTLKIKPIRTFFRSDSTWNSAHFNLADSLVYNPGGKWWVNGDTLVMLQNFPVPDTTNYLVTLNKDTASFSSMVDWDGDKKKDDHYFGKQVKVNRPR